MFGALPSCPQLLVFQFVGAPTSAELMATSKAALPPPEAMYALHRVWMPRHVASMEVMFGMADRQAVRRNALAADRLARIQTLEAERLVMSVEIGLLTRQVARQRAGRRA